MFRPTLVAGSAVLALLGSGVAPPAQAKPAPDFSQTIQTGRKEMRAALKQTGATSASIALLRKGKVVWSQGFGKANPAGDRPTGSTRYGIASVSKTVTAVAVMQLVDDGKINLDTPVVKYLPEFSMLSPQYRQITVRMLLNYSSGFPGSDYSNAISYQAIPGYAQEVLKALGKERLKTTPGAMSVYCNDCYTLAGLVVAAVSGMAFEDYVRQNIFTPLGMKNSDFSDAGQPSAPIIDKGVAQPVQYGNLSAAGGVVSTPRDMLRLAEVLTGGKPAILSQNAIDAMGTDQITTMMQAGPAPDMHYGLGWDTVQDPVLKKVGVTAWAKGGDLYQYHAGFIVAPEEDLAVAVMGAGYMFSSTVAESVGREILISALLETGQIKRGPKQLSGQPKVDKATAKQMKAATGIYVSSGVAAKLTAGDNRSLRFWVYGQGQWEKRPGAYVRRADGGYWNPKKPGASLRLVKSWDRKYLVLRSPDPTGTYYTSMVIGQRLKPDTLLPAWQQRIGQKWLLANENPASREWEQPLLKFSEIPGLSGYLVAEGAIVSFVPFDAATDPSLGSMFLQVPLMMGRDLYDFSIAGHGGEDVLTFASSVMRQVATVPQLSKGPAAIGSRGFVEWFTVPSDMSVTLSGQSAWKVFSEEFAPVDSGGSGVGEVTLKAGSYVALFGDPGAVVTVG